MPLDLSDQVGPLSRSSRPNDSRPPSHKCWTKRHFYKGQKWFFSLVEGALCTIAHCELGSVVRQIIAFYPALLEPRPPGLLLALTMPTLTSTLALAPHAHLQLGGPTPWPGPPPLHLVVCLHLWRPLGGRESKMCDVLISPIIISPHKSTKLLF